VTSDSNLRHSWQKKTKVEKLKYKNYKTGRAILVAQSSTDEDYRVFISVNEN
jgi:hypothetical protein